MIYSFGDEGGTRVTDDEGAAGESVAVIETSSAIPGRTLASYWRDALPANDALDKQILKLFVPAMLNFLIIPFVGAIDVFWVGRMGRAVALAAQGAANQVFQSAFWIISFVPSIIAPVVAKAMAVTAGPRALIGAQLARVSRRQALEMAGAAAAAATVTAPLRVPTPAWEPASRLAIYLSRLARYLARYKTAWLLR